MGAFVSLQGQFSHDMDSDFSTLVSFQGCTEIDQSLDFSGTTFYIVLAYLFRFQFIIQLLIMLSSGSIFASSTTFLELILLYSLKQPSWIRVRGRLVPTTDHMVMDS